MVGGNRASEHPSPADLDRFLRGELATHQAAPVVSHLLTGCLPCRQTMAPLAALLLFPRAEPPEVPASSLTKYDFPLFRAFANAGRIAATWQAERTDAACDRPLVGLPPPKPLSAAHRSVRDRARCEACIERSRSLRRRDPDGMLMSASFAVSLAERMEPQGQSSEQIADLQARAWAELGNARRVAGELADAEADLGRALDRADRGTGDRSLLADLMDLSASLFVDQRRFPEALRLLDGVEGLHRAAGDLHAAGRALVSKGTATGHALDHEAAIGLLVEALRLLDAQREPRLVLMAIHNLLMFLVEVGRSAEAARLFAQSRSLYRTYAVGLDRLRAGWLEGRIAAGQGDDASAETAFKEVRSGFVDAAMPYDAALVSLELAAVWLRRGRAAEIQGLVDEMLAIFQARRIRREAIGALLVLREACERQGATAALLQAVTAELQKLEREPQPLQTQRLRDDV